MKEKAAERRPFLLHKQKICCTIGYIGYWRIEMKYSKDGTLYDLRHCGNSWIVVSFYNPLFGKEVGKGSEAAMKAFYELLTKDGRNAVGFEYNGVKAVLPKIEMFVEDKIETTGLLRGLVANHVWVDDKCFFGVDIAKEKDRTEYSRKTKIPSQTKSSCGLGKAQKEFMARLGVLQ